MAVKIETHDEFNRALIAILQTLNEVDPEPATESVLYMALGCNIEQWNTISGLLTKGGLITTKAHQVSITPAGREMVARIAAAK